MPSQSNARIFVVGANHRSSTALLRDRLFMEESLLPQMFGRLRAGGLDQALILSTCDRTEIQGVHDSPETAADLVQPVRSVIPERKRRPFFRGLLPALRAPPAVKV